MQSMEQHLRNSSRAMRVAGLLCLVGLPLAAVLYPPGVLWGAVSPADWCFPRIGPQHPPSPYDGLHPYFFMVAAMYVSFGYLMLRGARDPKRNAGLFDYGIVSSIVHGGIMIPQAFFYPNEHAHLWTDIPFAALLAIICYVWHPERVPSGQPS